MYSPYGHGRTRIRFGGPLTPAVKALLIANVAVFALMFLPRLFGAEGGAQIVYSLQVVLGMTPQLFWGSLTLWMPFTYMFLHGGFYHVLFNMFALWMFGGDVEKAMGTRLFLVYYLFCGVGAGLLVAVLQPLLAPETGAIPTVGASGAIYGVILAFGLFFPERVIYLNLLIPIKAKWFVLIVGVMVFVSSMAGAGGGISHIAHLGGLVFGYIFIRRHKLWAMLGGRGRSRRSRDPRVIDLDKIRNLFEDDDDYRVH